jgi:archaellum component FlaC
MEYAEGIVKKYIRQYSRKLKNGTKKTYKTEQFQITLSKKNDVFQDDEEVVVINKDLFHQNKNLIYGINTLENEDSIEKYNKLKSIIENTTKSIEKDHDSLSDEYNTIKNKYNSLKNDYKVLEKKYDELKKANDYYKQTNEKLRDFILKD